MCVFAELLRFKKTAAAFLLGLVVLCSLSAENVLSAYKLKIKQMDLHSDDVNSFDRLYYESLFKDAGLCRNRFYCSFALKPCCYVCGS